MLITPLSSTNKPGTGVETGVNAEKAASVTKTSSSTIRVSACMLYMRLMLPAAAVWRTVVQAANEIQMLKESKKLQLAQKYFGHYADDVSTADKPCLSNQLYRDVGC